jgi:AI-2 transport protein TqsA
MTPTDRKPQRPGVEATCLLILAACAVGGALYLMRPVLIPFFLALFLTYCLSPVIDFQVKHLRAPRWLAILGSAILGLLVVALFGFVVAVAIGKIADNADRYLAQLRQLREEAAERVPLESLGLSLEGPGDRPLRLPETWTQQVISAVVSQAFDTVTAAGLVAIFLLFLLFGSRGVDTPPAGLLAEIKARMQRYLLELVFFSLVSGLLVWATLEALGVEFAFVFGFLAFVLNFIPSIGGVLATLLPVPVILLSPDMPVAAKVLAVALPAAIQFVLGSFIQPRVQANSLNVHPVALLMAILFFGMIWGVVGTFLATPMTGMVKLFLERIPATRPLAALLAGNLEGIARLGETSPPGDEGLKR